MCLVNSLVFLVQICMKMWLMNENKSKNILKHCCLTILVNSFHLEEMKTVYFPIHFDNILFHAKPIVSV